jgi:hypothetical protein
MEWEEIIVADGKYKKLILDLGYAKIVILGPLQNGEYWWNVKIDEKGFATDLECAKKTALQLLNKEN